MVGVSCWSAFECVIKLKSREFFSIWYLYWEYFYFEKIIYNYKRNELKKMVIICCSTLTALFSWLLLHTQAKQNSWHPPPNKQSQQSNLYKDYVCSQVNFNPIKKLKQKSVFCATLCSKSEVTLMTLSRFRPQRKSKNLESQPGLAQQKDIDKM